MIKNKKKSEHGLHYINIINNFICENSRESFLRINIGSIFYFLEFHIIKLLNDGQKFDVKSSLKNFYLKRTIHREIKL